MVWIVCLFLDSQFDIPVRKVFDTLRQYSNDITYEFVEKTLNVFPPGMNKN